MPNAGGSPPETPRDDVVDDYHGVKVSDPYRWLEDQNSPETRKWIDAENAYTRSQLDSLPGRESLSQQIAALLKVDTIGLPRERDGRYFYLKRRADQDLYVLYMRRGFTGPEEVLIDPHSMSADHSTSIALEDVSDDGTLLAYGVRKGGEDEVTVHLFDIDRRADLPDVLPRARYISVAFTGDKRGIYYSRQMPEGPRVYFHALGTDSAQDKEIFGKGYGPDKIIGVNISDDARFLVIHVFYGAAGDTTEVYFQDLKLQGPITPVVKDIPARFLGEVGGETLFLHTNWQAPNGRVLAVDLRNPGRDHWRTIIPENSRVIEDVALAGGRLFVNYLENARSSLEIFDPSGKRLGQVDLPTLGTVAGFRGRWKSAEAFYGFTSFFIPDTIYRYDIAAARGEVWARTRVPFNPEGYEVEQVWYTSKDGTRVPMFLAHRKGLARDGSAPVLLTGYGGFNVSETPAFSSRAVVWVERGGVFALPSLRGGGEFGEKWHHAGMFGNKQNVFDDFISAAQWLVDNHYTNPSKLAITGASNGGLLVGAALTQRPDLFRAVVCRYPLLDMLRYQEFLVARFWVSEYGSSEKPDQFKYLRAYSPYQNVHQGTKYPAVLLVSGDGDTRVAPLHARKMAALLQWATGSDRPVLLLYDTKSGHSGGRPVHVEIDEETDELSFLFWQLGVQPGTAPQ